MSSTGQIGEWIWEILVTDFDFLQSGLPIQQITATKDMSEFV